MNQQNTKNSSSKNIIIPATFIAAIASTLWIININWHEPISLLFSNSDNLSINQIAVQSSLLPRIFMAIFCGAALSISTLLLQQVMRNPLASDSTLAVNSGAQMALLIATIFAPALLEFGNSYIAFAGAGIALALVMALSAKRGFAPLVVVLAGLVCSLYLGAVSGVLILLYSQESSGVLLWASGSLVQDGWGQVRGLLISLIIGSVLTAALCKPLNIMSLSDEQAASLGVPVNLIRLAALILAAFFSAAVVGAVGMLGFIGLAANSVISQISENNPKYRTLKSRFIFGAFMGALMLLIADNSLLLLEAYFSIQLPVGAVTSLIGAPLLLWLILKSPANIANTKSSNTTVNTHAPAKYNLSKTYIALLIIIPALFLGSGENGWYISFDNDILQLRYPRILLSLAAGIMLGCTGVLLQRLTKNPMASPELLGISSGTSLGVMSMILIFNITAGSFSFWAAGILSALFTLFIIMFFNRKNNLAPEKILLTGMSVAALSDAAVRTWSAGGDMRIQQLQIWLSGSTYQATPILSAFMLVMAIIILIICLPLSRWLALLSLDFIVAKTSGVNVGLARIALICIASILAALSTLLIGPLSFIGLLAPHLASLMGARHPKEQLLTAAALGGAMMVASDFIGRQINFPYEIPAGLIATLIGGAYFMLMMRKI